MKRISTAIMALFGIVVAVALIREGREEEGAAPAPSRKARAVERRTEPVRSGSGDEENPVPVLPSPVSQGAAPEPRVLPEETPAPPPASRPVRSIFFLLSLLACWLTLLVGTAITRPSLSVIRANDTVSIALPFTLPP